MAHRDNRRPGFLRDVVGVHDLLSEPPDQLMQPADAYRALGEAGSRQHPPQDVLHLDIVMIFSAVVSDERHPLLPSPIRLK